MFWLAPVYYVKVKHAIPAAGRVIPLPDLRGTSYAYWSKYPFRPYISIGFFYKKG